MGVMWAKIYIYIWFKVKYRGEKNIFNLESCYNKNTKKFYISEQFCKSEDTEQNLYMTQKNWYFSLLGFLSGAFVIETIN